MVQENMKAFGTMAEKETPKTKEAQPEIKGALTYKDCRTSIRISGWTSFRRRWVLLKLNRKTY